MCFKVENQYAEVDQVLAPSELQLFVYDVVQDLIHVPLLFGTQTSGMPRNFSESKLRHDVCDDG